VGAYPITKNWGPDTLAPKLRLWLIGSNSIASKQLFHWNNQKYLNKALITNAYGHKRRSSVNFGGRGKTFLPEIEKLTKCPNFTWYLPKKLTKFNFTWFLTKKNIFSRIGGQLPPPASPRILRLCLWVSITNIFWQRGCGHIPLDPPLVIWRYALITQGFVKAFNNSVKHHCWDRN